MLKLQYQINNSEVNFSNAKFWRETATLHINSIKNRIIVKREIQFENLTLEQEKRRKDKWWYNLEVNLSESRLANKSYYSIKLNICKENGFPLKLLHSFCTEGALFRRWTPKQSHNPYVISKPKPLLKIKTKSKTKQE